MLSKAFQVRKNCRLEADIFSGFMGNKITINPMIDRTNSVQAFFALEVEAMPNFID